MVTLIEDTNNFPDDRITERTFLISLNKWYKNTGVKLGIEQVFDKERTNNYGNHEHMFILKCSVLDDMPKCWARVLDNNGKAKISENDMTGEKEETLEIVDDADMVTLFIKANYTDNQKDYKGDDDLVCNNKAGNYQTIKPLLQGKGLLGDEDSSFTFNVDELLNDLVGTEFICKTGKNKNGRFIPVFEMIKEE